MIRFFKVVVLSLLAGTDFTRIDDLLLILLSILHEIFVVCFHDALLLLSVFEVDGQLLCFTCAYIIVLKNDEKVLTWFSFKLKK